ncbi:MAG: helix-hairpin-helix domain-containing protein [Acidimicrobiia bacterium]|nr:helix-hairpin-helix domain-containing protein [Acidimicrobiia bacterium]
MTRIAAVLALVVVLAAAAAGAQTAPAASGPLVNANTAGEAELANVPGLNAALAKAMVSRRPFASMSALDAFLGEQKLTREQRTTLYGRLFVPVKLNSASDEDILLIPGIGKRMLGEFKEYRPYKAIEQFRREIGKYVNKEELARLERYVVVD